jgi:hypothetical protein
LIIIEDILSRRKIEITFSDKDYDKINNAWEKTDLLLTKMSDTTNEFKDVTNWSTLTEFHWKFLIYNNLDFDRIINSQEYMESLHFLLSGYIKHIQTINSLDVELLKIIVINDKVIKIDANLSTYFEVKNKPKMRIV